MELPTRLHLKNVGGSDGLGLCVFAAATHAGHWHNEPVAVKLFDYMKRYPGGGWPEKFDRMIKACAEEMRLPVPGYIQHTAGDEEFLELAIRTGRYPCVTYAGSDGVFYSGGIDHMVNLAHLSSDRAAIHDNNYPGKWLWMSRKDFLDRWRARGGGWAIVFTSPGPPPIPQGGKRKQAEAEPVEPHTMHTDPLTGVVLGEGATYRYSYCGKPITKSEAMEAVGSPLTRDDQRLWVVAVLPTEAERQAFRQSWDTSLPYTLAVHAPDDWRVQDVGYTAGVYLVRPTGKGFGQVLARQEAGGGFAETLEALRRKDPDYKPPAGPDVGIPWQKVPVWVWVVAGVVVVLVITNRGKR